MKEKFIIILRWLGVLPVAFIAMYLGILVLNLSFTYIGYGEVVQNVNRFSGFGGHFIIGPFYVFFQSQAIIASMIFAGVFTAPNYKKIVYYIFVGIVSLMLIIFIYNTVKILLNPGIQISMISPIIEIIIQLFGTVSGIVLTGAYFFENVFNDKKAKY